jgi:hypothetical protein
MATQATRAGGWYLYEVMADNVSDLTLEVLKQIRDGINRMDGRLEKQEGLLREHGDLMREQGNRLDRVEQGLNDLGQFMRNIALDQQRHETFHAHHVEVLEKDLVDHRKHVDKDIEDLRERVRRLEGSKAG